MIDEPDMPIPEAERPLIEAGQGEAEGFEQAERQLRENAEHGPSPAAILDDQFSPEETKPDDDIYGEADEVIDPEDPERGSGTR